MGTEAVLASQVLDATTVGRNVMTLTNPGAITFPRFNADNTVSALSAADTRTALGLGTLYLPLTGGTLTGALEITQGTANTSVLTSTGYSLTGANAQSLIDLAGTWNTSGTPTLIKANITDTSSNANSLLVDLQVGGSTKFRISKLGTARTLGGNLPSAGGIGASGLGMELVYSGYGFGCDGNGLPTVVINSSQRVKLGTSGVQIINSGAFFWSSGSEVNQNATSDLYLYRDAAGTLAQRNSTSAQTFRVYNTYTSATSYERGKIEWDTNVLRIGTEKGSAGGSARALELQTDGTTRVTIGTTGLFTIADALNIAVGTTTGTKIGTGTTQKIGFYDKTPVVQPAAVADATDAASVITQLNALLSRMRDLGLIAT